MNFPCQGFQKLKRYSMTNKHTETETLTHAGFRVISKVVTFNDLQRPNMRYSVPALAYMSPPELQQLALNFLVT